MNNMDSSVVITIAKAADAVKAEYHKANKALADRILVIAKERDNLYLAGEWVLNVVNGVGKAGGSPEDGENEAAFNALKVALKEAE